MRGPKPIVRALDALSLPKWCPDSALTGLENTTHKRKLAKRVADEKTERHGNQDGQYKLEQRKEVDVPCNVRKADDHDWMDQIGGIGARRHPLARLPW